MRQVAKRQKLNLSGPPYIYDTAMINIGHLKFVVIGISIPIRTLKLFPLLVIHFSPNIFLYFLLRVNTYFGFF